LILDPPQPEYDSLKFDYDTAASTVERWSKLADAKETDLSKFRKRGGKLIMTYGWADQILQPMMGVHYYEGVVAKNGKDSRELRASVHDAWCGALRWWYRTRSQ
jgi:feruloyl esterase